jgi:hypothetical protein
VYEIGWLLGLGVSKISSSTLPLSPPKVEELNIPLSSDWFRVPRAIEYSGMPQATLYAVLADPESGVISFNLKLRKGQARGLKYILRQSLDAYLEKKAREAGVSR